MLNRLLMASLFLLGALGVPTAAVHAQEKYPSRPIEFIVPWGPGGGADILGRKAGKMLESILKVSLPVVNVAGATGQTGLNKMLTGEADGYTISVMTGDTFGTLAGPSPKWGLKDIVPLAIMIRTPSAFFAQESRFKTWADAEKAAKANPLKVAITGFGSPDDYTVKYMNKKGLKLVSVPFAKPGERYTAILGGHADLLFEQAGDVKGYLENKQMHPLIFFAAKRDANFANVPASGELGHNIFLPQFRMIIVKAGTPPDRVKILSDALLQVSKNPEYAAYLKNELGDPNSFATGADAIKFLENELKALKEHAK
jgi:tripartite-type tricarboxylate transporter receptor subunit TctC